MDIHQDHLRSFAEYNRLFNEQLYSVASNLSEQDRKRDMGAFFGSIHGTLNHILLADRIWLGRFSQAFPEFEILQDAELVYEVTSLSQELYPDFGELSSERRKTDTVIQEWVEVLTGESLAKTMRYSNSLGEMREHPLWIAVFHMFNHQTHHRGQVTTLTSQLGEDAGVTDYIAYACAAPA